MLKLSVLKLLILLVCCGGCAAIKVPVTWEDGREEKTVYSAGNVTPINHKAEEADESATSEKETFHEWAPEKDKHESKPVVTQHQFLNEWTTKKPIPIEYFEYHSKKPQFSVDVATFHGMRAPQKQFYAYPVRPHTRRPMPDLGRYRILQQSKPFFEPFHNFMNTHDGLNHYLGPILNNYEIVHPYKAEEPGLKKLYKDPNLQKVRDDVEENKNRLQQYEKSAGEANIKKDEYLSTPERTDEEMFGQQYKPVTLEEYKAEKKPLYYTPPQKHHLPHRYLNQKLKYPLPLTHIKIKPAHYQPLRQSLQNLRYQQEKRYGDERNEYPRVTSREKQNFAESPEGLDIYEDGKRHFDDYRHNVDTEINNYSNKYSPSSYSDDESSDLSQNENHAQKQTDNSEEEQFVPIKMYAQVRKTESIKHLPREAAYDDAESLDEIMNAPRLKEAVKSTKAQTIYSEEGYEDNAYDHAGQQKHASNHEGHGGFMKERENSGGRYKIPFISHHDEEGDGIATGNAYIHKNDWTEDEIRSQDQDASEISKGTDEEDDDNEYDLHEAGSENLNSRNEPRTSLSLSKDSEKTTITDENDGTSIKTRSERIIATNAKNTVITQAESENQNKTRQSSLSRKKRAVNFQVPKFSLKNTYLTESEIIEISKQKLPLTYNKLKYKYPYYFQNNINPNSPLRYAENLKFIPRKTTGGTEFYDSRTIISCPDVEPDVDPVPEKLKTPRLGENEDADSNVESNKMYFAKNKDQGIYRKRKKRQADFGIIKKSPRLQGLGDKIDCFKEKYFGEDPLDSPFFSEELIKDPEPLKEPIIEVLKLIKPVQGVTEPKVESSEINAIIQGTRRDNNVTANYFPNTIEVSTEQPHYFTNSLTIPVSIPDMLEFDSMSIPASDNDTFARSPKINSSDVYSDILQNIQSVIKPELYNENKNDNIVPLLLSKSSDDITSDIPNISNFKVYLNKEDINIHPPNLRLKRFAQFIYEPYKVVKGNQDQDSKKTTTSGNISPLIKQLQASKIVDHGLKTKEGDNIKAVRKMQPVKRNIKHRYYKNIHREDRAKGAQLEDDSKDFIDVSSVDNRRGEPRYELSNHKATYTPVNNSKAISREEYRVRAKTMKEINENKQSQNNKKVNSENFQSEKPINIYPGPYFDVSAYIPSSRDSAIRSLNKDSTIAFESINSPVRRRHKIIEIKTDKSSDNLAQTSERPVNNIVAKSVPLKLQDYANNSSYEEYEEYDEEVEHTTTTTTRKPIKIRRKIKVRITTTTPTPKFEQPDDYSDYTESEEPSTTSKPKNQTLRRLRKPIIKLSSQHNESVPKINNKNRTDHLRIKNIPKIQEKAVKTQKSTVITDSKSYGNNDEEEQQEDDRKEQIDSMIGGQKNMRDYINDYEEANKKNLEAEDLLKNIQSRGEYSNTDDISEEEEESQPQKEFDDKINVGDYDENEDNDSKDAEQDEFKEIRIKEPVEKSSYIRQDTKISKAIPKMSQSNKYQTTIKEEKNTYMSPNEDNVKPLQMYQDENLAKDVNKLAEKAEEDQHRMHSDVEVFKENVQLMQGPRHGGNYRSAQLIEDLDEREDEEQRTQLHGGNLKSVEENADVHERVEQDNLGRSAALLNTLAQAATVLTTTPKYILDPSKRMYYYVDAR